MKRKGYTLLAVLLAAGDEPPTEFRIFRAGKNETSKGTFVFDEAAARAVMADYEKHGADVMLDLEHMSIDDNARNWDPDARGWCKLELRGGELWAVDVKWTDDGAARLRAKTQRYISPAFAVDQKTKRITKILNIAICAMPATHQLEPLVAATERTTNMKLSPNDLKIAAALAAVVSQLSAAESPELKQLGLQIDAELDKQMGAAPAADGAPPSPEAEAAKIAAKAELKANAAILATVREVTGKSTPEEVRGALSAMKSTRSENTELASQVVDLGRKLEAFEAREVLAANRKKLTPSVEARLKDKLAAGMGLAELKSLVEFLPERDIETRREPEKKGDGPVELTAEELVYCKRQGADPKVFLAQKQKLAAARAAEGV